MGFNFNRPGSGATKTKSIGNVALEIESISNDIEKGSNSITGTNIDTGEQMTIRLATMEEFARIMVSAKISGPAAREAAAEGAIGNRSDIAGVTKSSFDGAVVQFDDVRQTSQGDHIARWASSLTTNSPKFQPEFAAKVTAEVTTFQYKNKDGESAIGTKVTGVLTSEAFPGESPDARSRIAEALEGKVGNLPKIDKAGVLVAITEPGNDQDKKYAILSTQKGADKNFITGFEENLLREPVGKLEAMAQAAIAAITDVQFDDLKLSNATPEDKDWLNGMYDAIQNGDLKVSVAPSFEAGMMPKIEERLHKQANTANGMLERGFFEANIGIRQGTPKPDSPGTYDASIREVKPVGFLPNKTHENFVRDRLDSVAGQVVDGADKIRERKPEPAMEKDSENTSDFGAPGLG